MGIFKNFTSKLFYTDGGGRVVPAHTGDRLWAQDVVRDFRFLQGLPGRLLKAAAFPASTGTALCFAGLVTPASATTINLAGVVGMAQVSVDVPDDTATWAVPAAKTTAEIWVMVEVASLVGFSLASATLNGVATNYVKVAPLVTSLQSRQRHFEVGTWAYAHAEGYTVTCDTTAPASNEVLLATLIGDGATNPVITQSNRVTSSAITPPPVGTTYTQLPDVFTFTAAVSDVITATAHGLVDGQGVRFTNSGGALPAGLSAGVTYYVRDRATDSFKVSLSSGGTAVDITGTGTGTHTCWAQDSPADLWPGTTWLNVSAKYADGFFRVEGAGSVASVFGAGQQASQNKTHTHGVTSNVTISNVNESSHTHNRNSGGNQELVWINSAGTYITPGGSGYALGTYTSTGAGSAHSHANTLTNNAVTSGNGSADGTDLRPINRTVRIWKRTA